MKKGRKGKRQKGISLPIRTSNSIDFPHVIMIYINNNLQGSGRGKRNNDNWREAFEGQSMGLKKKCHCMVYMTHFLKANSHLLEATEGKERHPVPWVLICYRVSNAKERPRTRVQHLSGEAPKGTGPCGPACPSPWR